MSLTCHRSPVAHDQVRHWACLQQEPHACGPSLDSVCSCFPPCFLQCVAAAWPSQASSSRTRSTSAPRTTSNSMAPAVTAAGTSSRARSSRPWAAPTTPSASCAACAGERVARGGRVLCLSPGKGRGGLPQAALGFPCHLELGFLESQGRKDLTASAFQTF